ncbi:MAG: ethanolamine ammonia-lyase reactivating factor EutA, partial [Eubacteriales bacterium]
VNPSFVEIKKLAECIADSFKSATNGTVPVIVVVESDMAKVLGQSIHKCFDYNREVVCLDNIKVTQGDYIDIGKPLMKGQVVPIVVKTLIFG